MSQLPGAPGFRRTLCWGDLGYRTAGGAKLTVHQTGEAQSEGRSTCISEGSAPRVFGKALLHMGRHRPSPLPGQLALGGAFSVRTILYGSPKQALPEVKP